MTITIHIPTPLRAECQGTAKLYLDADTVRDALGQLEQDYPSLYRSVCDETGAVRRHINLFINTAHLSSRDGLDTALSPGDVIDIMPAVSGG
jgi:MoaD family protein